MLEFLWRGQIKLSKERAVQAANSIDLRWSMEEAKEQQRLANLKRKATSSIHSILLTSWSLDKPFRIKSRKPVE